MEKAIIGRVESHYGAVLVKTVGLAGVLKHHWFDEIDDGTLEYTGYTAYMEDTQTGVLERVETKQPENPTSSAMSYAESEGYNIIG